MDQVLDAFVVIGKTLWLIFVAIIKSFLPNGALPRKDVKGQTVLITGAGSGLGRLLAYEFGKLGCYLVLWDVNEKGNEETRQTLESAGVKIKKAKNKQLQAIR
ncbi:unnamed protein product [Caenorhabditis auriculariae]|uniref:Uncharacterized protein n=1 Tax=Caenorhabditis auriculariae TaxID=2777116 RepID=A0A8S1H303_9PELO|nr:unnamed protein product [Caenorhabditis auriculariae]